MPSCTDKPLVDVIADSHRAWRQDGVKLMDFAPQLDCGDNKSTVKELQRRAWEHFKRAMPDMVVGIPARAMTDSDTRDMPVIREIVGLVAMLGGAIADAVECLPQLAIAGGYFVASLVRRAQAADESVANLSK